MHKFSDFADEKALDGNKLFINNVVNKEIEILNFRISKSKQKAGTNCLTLQFKLDGIVYVLFTGSNVLIEQILKYKEKVPFLTTIKKINNYYSFT